jgi:transaldolase
MNNIKFFFDTADSEVITKIWNEIGQVVVPSSVLGITTNPNALNSVGCSTLTDLEKVIPKLCSLVTSLRQDSSGVVYVQTPNSHMEPSHILKWAKYISSLTDGITAVGIKIPHYTYALDLSPHLADMGVEVNVTGIADWGTLLKAFSYHDVTYASLITGRMESRGIPASEHLEHITKCSLQSHQYVIAGSMRTIDNLKDVIARKAIPTIGIRVWEAVLKNSISEFPTYWNYVAYDEPQVNEDFVPLITEESRKLSLEFFQQMDQLGRSMYEEFLVTCQ